MFSRIKNSQDSITPKRRRLGTGRIVRPRLRISDEDINNLESPDMRPSSPTERNDDLPLPCNQIEYLHDSGNTSSTSSDIPCSPGVLDDSMMKNVDKWESLVVSRENNVTNTTVEVCKEVDEIENINDDMFQSKLEQESSQFNHVEELLTSRCEKHFRDHIEESFDCINKSINEVCNESNKNNDVSLLFETKDSFLLDIKESGIVLEHDKNVFAKPNTRDNEIMHNKDSFYGLPKITKSLFETYRNIQKFYDWQEECLNLDAIKQRRNLIYALPTSGGKTLVAEVLMLREMLNRRKNALFILPFVAIVQEKIWSLSPFALKLDFLVEEYAAGKGHIPPKKRRNKNSIYIATFEKALALVRSLIELDRLDELGLIVVDELHLIGEPGRGGTLETLLTTVLFANRGIQVVGMSATIGNLPDVARFLRADVFEREFRPVELVEFVKLGDMLHRIHWGKDGVEVQPHRQLAFDYSAAGLALDPDLLGGLVSEVVPSGAVLVFCPTKRNAENVAALLARLQRKEMLSHRASEREALAEALRSEGAGMALQRVVRAGVAHHHAGLGGDERALLEHAYRAGVISVICCTSTLAAGVNLPASRVILRAPRVAGRAMMLAEYRQMAGRAGRAGVCDTGDSIMICDDRDWPQLLSMLRGGVGGARSALREHVGGLLLSGVALGLADTRPTLVAMLDCSLLAAIPDDDGRQVDTKQVCDEALRGLIKSGALRVAQRGPSDVTDQGQYCVYADSRLEVSTLGKAAIKGGLSLAVAQQLVRDLGLAARALVLMGGLHLLYLVTPHDAANIRPQYAHYYSLYCELDAEGVQTAKILGITEMNAVRMMTGKPITNVSEQVLCRFYLAMMLHELWKETPLPVVAEKYNVPRGTLQTALSSASSLCCASVRVCEELGLWAFRSLFAELAPRLQHCADPNLAKLMELSAVRKARAMQLVRAGYKRVEDLAKASADELVSAVDHLTRTSANHLISAARAIFTLVDLMCERVAQEMMLIEKVENLRAEAEDVMEELNTKG